MSNPLRLTHARRAGIVLAAGFACAVVPVAAQASAVNLATASPFAVLGGSTVTNTGPSVLNGDLGVYPGTSLTGFDLPAVVNGATHDDDAVAGQAQGDLTTAYNVAAGQAVPPGNVLTGQDLGGLTLTAGAYSFASSAQLTGQLTLDAAGDPNAQFVFEIGSTLTTASASSVHLIGGASPCNVYWQVGSSATVDTTTAFAGNLMANTSITLNDAATVQGRLLASNGAVVLHNNVIDPSMCGTSTTPPPGTPAPGPTTTPTGDTPPADTTPPAGTPGATPTPTPATTGGAPAPGAAAAGTPGGGTGAQAPPASTTTVLTRNGTATFTRSPHSPGVPSSCTVGFSAAVTGHQIKRVVFTLDGKTLASRSGSPFHVYIPASAAGSGKIRAHVTFKDATRAKTLSLSYIACAAAVLHPRRGPSKFTG